jgi:hypothetical protein
MAVYKAHVTIAGEVYEIHTVDVIEHEGQFWLVPEWLDSPDRKWTKPARIVSLATIQHQTMRGPIGFVVNDPIPKSVLFGQPSPEEASRFVIVEAPEIQLPHPGALH